MREFADAFDTPTDIEMLVEQALISAVEMAVEVGFVCAHIDELLAQIRGAP